MQHVYDVPLYLCSDIGNARIFYIPVYSYSDVGQCNTYFHSVDYVNATAEVVMKSTDADYMKCSSANYINLASGKL